MCKPLIKDFEEINGELELSDQCMHIIVDCLTIWRALLATGSNTLDLSNPEDLEMYTNAVLTMLEMSAQTSSRNMKAVVGQVIVSNDFWGNKFKDFMTVEPNSRTCCPS
jgi:adenosyl cobinamide kinase/adenosyl cobinamide phosphate guanylyltransferase